ncbi:hypothetical protein ABW20_dc0106632 [Dactylellina cionopaga]|nr:hypothetical protein ABW20_dc0106632 [Dactylellina cionopaga]
MAEPLEQVYDDTTTVFIDDTKVQPFGPNHWNLTNSAIKNAVVGYLPTGAPFRARITTRGPCSIVSEQWWHQNVHNRSFPWVGGQTLKLSSSSIISVHPSQIYHEYPADPSRFFVEKLLNREVLGGLFKIIEKEDEITVIGITPEAWYDLETNPDEEPLYFPTVKMGTAYKITPFRSTTIPFQATGFSILPLIISGRPHFIPVMISPCPFPATMFEYDDNNDNAEAAQTILKQFNTSIDGLLHIDIFTQLGIKTFFSKGGHLNGRLLIDTELPNFNFVKKKQGKSSDVAVAFDVFAAKYKYPITGRVVPLMGLYCDPESMYNDVWLETPMDTRHDDTIDLLDQAVILGAVHGMKTAWYARKRHGYPYIKATICINSKEAVEDLRYWNQRILTADAAEVYRKSPEPSDAWADAFVLMKKARIEGFYFEFYVMGEERERKIGAMVKMSLVCYEIKKGWRDSVGGDGVVGLPKKRLMPVVEVGQQAARSSISKALYPNCLAGQFGGTEKEITRNDIMDLLPRGILVSMNGEKPEDPHRRVPFLRAYFELSEEIEKEKELKKWPPSKTWRTLDILTPRKKQRVHKSDNTQSRPLTTQTFDMNKSEGEVEPRATSKVSMSGMADNGTATLLCEVEDIPKGKLYIGQPAIYTDITAKKNCSSDEADFHITAQIKPMRMTVEEEVEHWRKILETQQRTSPGNATGKKNAIKGGLGRTINSSMTQPNISPGRAVTNDVTGLVTPELTESITSSDGECVVPETPDNFKPAEGGTIREPIIMDVSPSTLGFEQVGEFDEEPQMCVVGAPIQDVSVHINIDINEGWQKIEKKDAVMVEDDKMEDGEITVMDITFDWEEKGENNGLASTRKTTTTPIKGSRNKASTAKVTPSRKGRRRMTSKPTTPRQHVSPEIPSRRSGLRSSAKKEKV